MEKPQKAAAGGIDYNKTAFFLIAKDGSQSGTYLRARNKKEHDELVVKARTKGLYLYYGSVRYDEVARGYVVVQPLIVDFDSVPDTVDGKWTADDKLSKAEHLECPYCGMESTSKPGQTLHIKAKHPDKFEEFKNTNRKTETAD